MFLVFLLRKQRLWWLKKENWCRLQLLHLFVILPTITQTTKSPYFPWYSLVFKKRHLINLHRSIDHHCAYFRTYNICQVCLKFLCIYFKFFILPPPFPHMRDGHVDFVVASHLSVNLEFHNCTTTISASFQRLRPSIYMIAGLQMVSFREMLTFIDAMNWRLIADRLTKQPLFHHEHWSSEYLRDHSSTWVILSQIPLKVEPLY